MKELTGDMIFKLFVSYGFPPEMSLEEAKMRHISVNANWKQDYINLMEAHKEISRQGNKFKETFSKSLPPPH